MSSGIARAATVHYEFSGVVTELTGFSAVFGPLATVEIGDPFSGRLSYETGAGNPDQDPSNTQQGVYNLSSLEVDQSIVAIAPTLIRIQHIPGLATIPPAPPDFGTDSVTFAGTWFDGTMNRALTIHLGANYNAALSNDSLPGELSLSDFPEPRLVRAIRTIGIFPFPGQEDAGELNSLVRIPEPASLSGAAVGVALLFCGGQSLRTKTCSTANHLKIRGEVCI